jgi:hypothetical protein
MVRRYAMVRGYEITCEKVAPYLPSNYRVEGQTTTTETWGAEYPIVVISGKDESGFTLHDYVIPRLGSGLMSATEIDLSHPVMKTIPLK